MRSSAFIVLISLPLVKAISNSYFYSTFCLTYATYISKVTNIKQATTIHTANPCKFSSCMHYSH